MLSNPNDGSFLLLFVFGTIVRIGAILHPGYGRDIVLFQGWAAKAAVYGSSRMYDSSSGGGTVADYPPVMLYIYSIVGRLIFTVQKNFHPSQLFLALVKLPAILCDCGTAVYLLRLGRRIGHGDAGLLAAGLFFLLPAAWLDSAIWGQVDIIYSVFLLVAFVSIGTEKPVVAGVAAALAFTTKFQAIAFLPALAVIALAQDWRYLVRSLASFGITVLIVTLPFIIAGQAHGVMHAYEAAVSAYRVLSINAFNLWYVLFGSAATRMSDVSVIGTTGLTYKVIGLVIYALGVTGFLVALWRKIRTEKTKNVMLIGLQAAAISALLFFLLPTEMHERYAYPYIVFACLPAAISRGRSLVIYMLLAVAIALNIAHALSISITDLAYAAFPEAGRAIGVAIIALTLLETALFLRPQPEMLQATPQP